MEINSKRRRYTRKTPVDGDGIDIISNLPKEILCHILSFLPTKYAAGTSILSKKWQNLLPLIPNLSLQLDDSLFLNPHSPRTRTTHHASFAKFNNNLLNVTLRDVPSLSSLTLICEWFFDEPVVAVWVTEALRRNIKKMYITIYDIHSHTPLLDSLFGCNIVSLNLVLVFPENLTEFRFSFPNLKRLVVRFMIIHAVNALLACCPVLEYLLLSNCYCFYSEPMIRICVPLLKDLEIVNNFIQLNCVIEIDAPGLLYLKHSGYLAICYWVREMKLLRLAHLDLEDGAVPFEFDSDEPVAELLKVCSGVEKLSLSKKFISMLHNHPHQLPRFHKLVDLTINDMELYGWELLPSLLDSAPNIKNLKIKGGFDNILFESFKAAVVKSMSIVSARYDGKYFHLVIERNVGI